MSRYLVSVYDGGQHPALRPYASSEHATERAARQAAARYLGHASLRGAASWDRYQGGTVYQFGPRREDSEYDWAVIYDQGGVAP